MSLLKKSDNSITPNAENLVLAIESGDLARVKYFIAVGVDVNSLPPDESVVPPLGYAIAYGHTDMIKVLLKAGAKVHDFLIAQLPHLPSIVEAAGQEVYDILTLLIKAGIDVDFSLEEGDTLLHKAVEDADTPLVDFLLRVGADVNRYNQYGWTPLMSAVFYVDSDSYQLEIVKSLLENGADIKLEDNSGKSVLAQAKEAGVRKEVVQLLQESI
ncbi:ankyrin repeat domain-containing protein [Lusitaniella coriacea]|uniref:ankyrin repeat domain-containing protein n=1 Tax=Lusitaniella coriacea TaxID=1983105 RepID=UPI003CF87705